MDEYKKIVCPKIFFQKNNFKYEILNHLYFGPNFFFGETALGRFSQVFFFNFLTSVRHGDRHFYSAAPPPPLPHHKKAFYGPGNNNISNKSHCMSFIYCIVVIIAHDMLKIHVRSELTEI